MARSPRFWEDKWENCCSMSLSLSTTWIPNHWNSLLRACWTRSWAALLALPAWCLQLSLWYLWNLWVWPHWHAETESTGTGIGRPRSSLRYSNIWYWDIFPSLVGKMVLIKELGWNFMNFLFKMRKMTFLFKMSYDLLYDLLVQNEFKMRKKRVKQQLAALNPCPKPIENGA